MQYTVLFNSQIINLIIIVTNQHLVEALTFGHHKFNLFLSLLRPLNRI
ncbi:hypothetical protein ACOMCP_02846 [Lactiplantibacillus plantarum]|uniref:Uncharacterized protein n=1 Tax=Lactiplantibacillus plantarum TaxID=1590 RepID=A0A1E3KVB8_LACPN|nr:hypothetical protein [Lactiplantibacillus plantarum]ODO62838.1 hypothetical protein LPJSA22_02856 [Lactiplantibacillus plantarum]QHM30229.1 hypothetical protein C7M34_00848 [Lactiplantibacillus plantarum]QHM34114.1 hypothetical protein C7M35_01490 [Lactiplantibacillus plantarum]QHM63233.1 hypothetical protein C7M47_02183 [Lactiplantibacillus plantarum]